MEKEINDSQNQLQELLETRSFEALNVAQKAAVLDLVSESEYKLRRRLILSSQAEPEEKAIPLPLILPAKESKVMVMPVYQAMLAVAASIVVMWFLKFPFEQEKVSAADTEIQYVAKIDTVYSEKFLYDTIYKIIEKPTVVEKTVYETRTVVKYVESPDQIAATKVLNAPMVDMVPDLEQISAEVDGGANMSVDNTLNLVPDMILRD